MTPPQTAREKLISLHDRAAKGELQSILANMNLPEETRNIIDYVLDVHCVSMLWLADREEFDFQELPRETTAVIPHANNQCVWVESDSSVGEIWASGCGETHIHTSPTDNGFSYCPFCGEPIEIEEYWEPELPDGRDVLRYATSLGAEAKANNRKTMNGDDREDIALKAGYTKWVEIPAGMREEASAAFYTGWRNE